MLLAAHARLVGAIPLIAASLMGTSIAQAEDMPPPTREASLTPMERKADLALWRKSGAADLQSAASYDLGFAARYADAYQKYLLWRNGPEFAAEVVKLQGSAGR